jgi:hypothetical protein
MALTLTALFGLACLLSHAAAAKPHIWLIVADGESDPTHPNFEVWMSCVCEICGEIFTELARCAHAHTVSDTRGTTLSHTRTCLTAPVADLGFGDLGYTGSSIKTPNIDALATSGVILGNYYVRARVWMQRNAQCTQRSHAHSRTPMHAALTRVTRHRLLSHP